jgi:hypothetical protein
VWLIFFVFLFASLPATAAPVCRETEVAGAYGAQSSGETTIAGTRKPAVTLSRLVFNADKSISGYSSVSFDGLLLGNPVTGTYETKSDCSMTWSLQDDSGGYQHFSATTAPGGNKIEVVQTDPGAGQHGIVARTSDACTAADVRPQYGFTWAKAKAVLDVATDGTITITGPEIPSSGTIQVDSDCIVHIEFGDQIKLRGILVSGGGEMLAIRIDPGTTTAVRFIAR